MEDMNQNSLAVSQSRAFAGAAFMVLGGVVFSLLNVVTQWLTMKLAFPSASAAFCPSDLINILDIRHCWGQATRCGQYPPTR